MINTDPFIALALNYVHVNPLTFAAVWGLLKLLAKKSSNNTDDKILTWLGNLVGIKF